MNETSKLPLWKNVLEEMRLDGLGYGRVWRAEFFEERLRCDRNSAEFAFSLMAIKNALEADDGYYFRSAENGDLWDIPAAAEYEEICQRLERGIRRDAVRVINLRSATLMNPQAQLSEVERQRMERNLEKAAVRMLLISRQNSVAKILQRKAPKLLEQTRKS